MLDRCTKSHSHLSHASYDWKGHQLGVAFSGGIPVSFWPRTICLSSKSELLVWCKWRITQPRIGIEKRPCLQVRERFSNSKILVKHLSRILRSFLQPHSSPSCLLRDVRTDLTKARHATGVEDSKGDAPGGPCHREAPRGDFKRR